MSDVVEPQDPRVAELVAHIATADGFTVTATASSVGADGTRRIVVMIADRHATPAPGQPATPTPTIPRPLEAAGCEVQELAELVKVHVPRGLLCWQQWQAASVRWWTSASEIARARDYLTGLLANVGIAPNGTDLLEPVEARP